MELALEMLTACDADSLQDHLRSCTCCRDSFTEIAWIQKQFRAAATVWKGERYGGDLAADLKTKHPPIPMPWASRSYLPAAAILLLVTGAAVWLLQPAPLPPSSVAGFSRSAFSSHWLASSGSRAPLTFSPNPPRFSQALALGGEALSQVRPPSRSRPAGE
jgi:hypothetical protein